MHLHFGANKSGCKNVGQQVKKRDDDLKHYFQVGCTITTQSYLLTEKNAHNTFPFLKKL